MRRWLSVVVYSEEVVEKVVGFVVECSRRASGRTWARVVVYSEEVVEEVVGCCSRVF